MSQVLTRESLLAAGSLGPGRSPLLGQEYSPPVAALPSWLQQPQPLAPAPTVRGHDAWISHNLAALARTSQGFLASAPKRRPWLSPAWGLLLLLGLVLAIALIRDPVLLLALTAGWLLRLVCLPRASLVRIFVGAATAGGFALLLWLPALLIWGASGSWLLGPWRICLSVGWVGLLAGSWGRRELGQALAAWHLPPQVVLAVDQALFYLVILSRLGGALFLTLQKRSVGWNRQPRSSLNGIIGTLFWRSWQRAQLGIQAMECRGFSGSFGPMARAKHQGKAP